LLSYIETSGEATGLFSYYDDGDRYDHSCSNYGVPGMWAVAQNNREIADRVWQVFDMAWRRHQRSDGGWAYQNDKDARGTLSMTSAAVATLFITQDYLYATRGLDCKGNIVDENIERGLHWMGQHLQQFEGHWPCYTLYNIERAGVASGHKYLGTTDWYKVGADFLVGHQRPDGSWGNLRDTCWAILFLVRGRAPVMMNKLEYTVDRRGDNPRPPSWNERPRDVANIARWTSRQIERDLNWQIVNLKVDIRDLHDAPILYIAGKESLNFTPEEEKKLADFVHQGGLIVGNADCASLAFANSFRKLGTKLFGTEFRELPADHCICSQPNYPRARWRFAPTILALSNGVRELMILYPGADPARYRQTQSFLGPDRQALAQSIANIFLYSVSRRDLRFKGESHIVRRDDSVKAQRTISVARLQYPGNWDPEPGGWRRLANLMHNQHKTDLKVEPVKLGGGTLGNYAAAHLTGIARIFLSEAAKAQLKQYVEGGGTLLIDSAGGNADFASSVDEQLKALFGTALAVLPPDHELYRTGNTIGSVDYRLAARRPAAPRPKPKPPAGKR